MGRAPVGKLPPGFWIRSRMPQRSVSPAGRWFKVQPGLPRGFGFLVSIQSWHIKTKVLKGKIKSQDLFTTSRKIWQECSRKAELSAILALKSN